MSDVVEPTDEVDDDSDALPESALEEMPESPPEPEAFSPVEILDVQIVLPESHARLILGEIDDPRRVLTIPIGIPDATAIAFAREGVATPRPLTHDLFLSALQALGVVIETVRITGLAGRTFFAELVLSGSTGPKVLDCRPSDAIALALRQELPVPITVATEVLDQLEPRNS